MILELEDEELSDVREGLRLQLRAILKELTRLPERRQRTQLRAKYERLDGLFTKLDHVSLSSAPH